MIWFYRPLARRHSLTLIVLFPARSSRSCCHSRSLVTGNLTGCVCLHALSSFQRTDASRIRFRKAGAPDAPPTACLLPPFWTRQKGPPLVGRGAFRGTFQGYRRLSDLSSTKSPRLQKNLLLTFLPTWTDSIGKDARAQERCSRITWQYLRAYLAESPSWRLASHRGSRLAHPTTCSTLPTSYSLCTRCTTCRWLFSPSAFRHRTLREYLVHVARRQGAVARI